MRSKLRTFLGLTAAERRMVVEAAVFLALARLLILLAPMRHLAPLLSKTPREGRVGDPALLRAVRQAVTLAARNAPWRAVCLPQAMAAKFMLTRRGCASTLHLGAGRDAATGGLLAHAWLACGETIVVGAAGMGQVTPLARFG